MQNITHPKVKTAFWKQNEDFKIIEILITVCFKIITEGTGEMIQKLRMQTAFAEDSSWVHSEFMSAAPNEL